MTSPFYNLSTFSSFPWESEFACIYRHIPSQEYGHFSGYFKAIKDFHRESTLIGLDSQLNALSKNTQAFINGKKSSHALLWGARGCGKSSCLQLVLSSFLHKDSPLRVIELPMECLYLVGFVQDVVRELPYKFIIVCDDLSLSPNENSYKSLKSVLEGSFENKPTNILFYTTSNQRHLIAESYPQDTLHLNDAKDEILSLSDRFGLALGFYTLGRLEFLELVAELLNTPLDEETKRKALQFSTLKGSNAPRIAQEFCTLYHNKII
ncbi:DUF815 domain-containing protein [Helicobacter magdeburgensis]|uniref:DUF815 domain-containing protein n=1 Tax=Helicobacter magdeburgensis TaxID=471858 RepID=A0A4U8SXW7_9HELI|nr:DUF815 domain-containing protein [Helicobacter magdeburgensis]TLD91796.1 DUF815 domain-containing protein [Helicobacter magdeburgensis]